MRSAGAEAEIETMHERRLPMPMTIPRPLKAEHEALHAELVAATKTGGRTGDAATAVAQLMHPHFLKEEAYALPPLGLLAPLADGAVTREMGAVLELTEKLRAELPGMLEEHKAILAALAVLRSAAMDENRPEVARFAEALVHHAETEEAVVYPAALLIGEYVRLRLGGDR
jgi:hypothetical protein